MVSERESSETCVCYCGSLVCRGVYVKRIQQRAGPASTTTMQPIERPKRVERSPSFKTFYEYKLFKFIDFMTSLTRNNNFVTWVAVRKRKQLALKHIKCFGVYDMSKDYYINFIQKNYDRLEEILNSHGKTLSLESNGFGIYPK